MDHLTDSQKIDALWNRLDAMNQELASTKVLLENAELLAARKQQLIEQRDATIAALTQEIRRLGVEVNDARGAAARAVREYIESQKAA